MRIAVPNYSGYIFQHFGRSDEFRIYDVDEEKKVVTNVETISTGGRHHAQLACWLFGEGVSVVICGGIGEGMQQLLKGLGITFYGGVTGSCDKAVDAFLHNELVYVKNPDCSDEHTKEHTDQTRETIPQDAPPTSPLEAYHDQDGKLHMPLLF